MPTLALNAPLPSARKNAPQPKSGGKSAPKSKRMDNEDKPKSKRQYNKKNTDYLVSKAKGKSARGGKGKSKK